MAGQPYQVEKAQTSCRQCETEFENGQIYMSALLEDADGNLSRRDYCPACWGKCEEALFSFWQTRCRYNKKTGCRMDNDALLAFYKNLDEKKEDEERTLELKYVLSLYLARKKILQLTDIKKDGDGAEGLIFEGPEKGRKTRIADPGLSAERIEELTETIRSLFLTEPG